MFWTPPPPGDWFLPASLGLLGGAGRGLLAPLTYTQLIWATLAGMLVFNEWPDAASLAGAAVIALGRAFVAFSGRNRR